MGNIYVDVWEIDDKPIDIAAGVDFVTTDANGAETVFVGTVRDLNHGKDVLGVSYDVFVPLALETFRDICKQVQGRWGADLDLYMVHAKGRLDVGGISIVIAVGSPHRDEAFLACRYMIEEVKHRAPIWKLEHYVDGDSEWARGCELCVESSAGV